MPKINRVRIVNFSYNNNNRHIIDECFDFYGGENALLSLANGGGKSVLVQAMLQPILPRVSLLKRKFGDFFAAKRTPSYIMIEWRLDDEAGYLLTGIAITPRVNHAANEEEENADIRYFTFLHAYDEGNHFDIKSIPVTEQVASSVRIASYNEFKKLLLKESGKQSREIFVYDSAREEQSLYSRKLNSYSISKEEWKELIVNINEAENGVSEVFSECKTSRKVMEQWVIKYIEKVLNKSADEGVTDHKKLETMMAQVAQALVDNENHIREYKAIEGFNMELGLLYQSAKTVLSQIDKEDKLKKEIGGGYQVLKNEEERLTQELTQIDNSLKELGDEMERITVEEKSQEIYEYTAQIETVNAKLVALSESIERQKQQLTEEKEKLNVQKAAEKYENIRQKEKVIAQLQQRLENVSKDQEELLQTLNQIKYSLKVAYKEQITTFKNEMDGIDVQVTNALDGIIKSKQERSAHQKQIEELNKKIGGVEREITNFEKEEPENFKSMGIMIYRNPLLKELDPQDIKKAETQLTKEYQDTEVLLNESEIEMGQLKNKLIQLKQSRKELAQRSEKLKVEESEITGKAERFQEEKQKVLSALKRLNINEEYLFEPEYLTKAAKEILNEWENKAYHLKMEISELEKQIHGIEKGISYLPESLVSLLEEHNLLCYTGEKYLREIPEEDKNRLIQENPFLPYALIATEKEITQITQLAFDMEFGQIIPIIRHNQREQIIEAGYENIQFITSSKNISLDNEEIIDLIKQLMEKKENGITELEKANEVIDRVNQDSQTILNFGWTQKQVQDLLKDRSVNAEKIAKNQEAIQACEQQSSDTEKQLEKVASQTVDLKEMLSARKSSINDFENYLVKNTFYMKNVHEYNKIHSEISSHASAKEKCDEVIDKLEREEKEWRSLLGIKNNNKEELEKKLMDVTGAVEAERIDEGILELEGKLEACKDKQNNEVADLNRQITGLKKDIEDKEKEIRRLKLATEEYKSVAYSERVEAELEKQCVRLEAEIELLKKDEGKLELTKNEFTIRIDVAKQALGDNQLVPVEQIKGNFTRRREEALKEQIKNTNRKVKVNEDELYLVRLISRTETEIKGIQYFTAEVKLKSFDEVNAAMDSILLEYGRYRRETNEAIDNFGKRSTQFVNNYAKNEEGTVKEAVKGLQYQLNTLDRTFDKYYYLTERMDYYFEQLSQILKIMESKMLQLEHSQKDLVEHSFVEANRIYHEIPKISENSAVEIDGVRKRVLEIQYEEMGNELQAKEKMNAYIQDCLQSLTKLIKGNEDDSKLSRDIAKYMSTKELLNIISSLENCRIKAYKVDLNEKNRRMMLWEDIIVKNSGGEKFVAYFSLLVALISYSRKQIKGYDAFKRKEESKVLIMDNPFGPITSGHLLKPMFDIAKKYNTQLICLSDIKQGSVLNSFDLIYMIKIRQNMMQEDFIELEPIHLKELKQDERLENAHLYGKIEQTSLFI